MKNLTTMIFTEDFFDKLPSDLSEATIQICNRFFEFNSSFKNIQKKTEYYFEYLDALAAIEAFLISNNITCDVKIPLTSKYSELGHIKEIVEFYEYIYRQAYDIVKSNTIESARFKYKVKLSNVFHYKLTDGDLSQIQELINNLRDAIINSEFLKDDHKERLLDRIEKIQKELHKKNTNFDKVYGLFFEGAILIEKYNTVAQPIFFIIKSIVRIVMAAQGNAEELPSNTDYKMLK